MRQRTPAQIQASRTNGAKSKGPLSPATRAVSARNATTHGLTANTILLEGESRERFQLLFDETVAALQPQSALEFTAVEEMVVALWKQRRSWALEAASFRAAHNKLAGRSAAADPAARSAQAWRELNRPGHDFHNLLLQQTRLDRQLDRAYRRFLAFAALRPELSQEPNEVSASGHPETQETPSEPNQIVDSTNSEAK